MPRNDISLHFSNHNLHIRCAEFAPQQADSVLELMDTCQKKCPHIFVDVQDVHEMDPAAVAHFKASSVHAQIRPRQLIFMGKAGFNLAMDGNLVLIPKKPEHKHDGHCCGKCAHCRCGKHKHV